MVDQIVQAGTLSPYVERAMRAVPRHAFVPEAPLTDAYDVELAVITKRASDGTALSWWLRLTATEPGTCRIAAGQAAATAGLCTPAIPARSPAIVEGASVAYFTLRRLDDAEEPRRELGDADEPRWELGAIGHGPGAAQLADRAPRT